MTYVGLEGSYKSFEIVLFEGEICLGVAAGNKASASSQFLLIFQKLLADNKKKIEDLQFIAVDQGPGAFTSLRVTMAMGNALAFDERVALLGIDGLEALAQQTWKLCQKTVRAPKKLVLVSLLNAYNNEVYYAVHTVGEELFLAMPKGYKKIDLFLAELKLRFADYEYLFTGNGSQMHERLIRQMFGDVIQEPFAPVMECSAEQIGEMGWLLWQKGERGSRELTPLYLKAQTFAIKQ